MSTRYTLHTDESGEFEGDMSRGHRLIAGLILPEMKHHALTKAREELLDLALEVSGERELKRLHGGESKGAKADRNELAQRVVEAVLRHVEDRSSAQLVLLSHADPANAEGRTGLLSADFAANRYQRMLVELVRQSLEYVSGPEQGSVFDLYLARRVFPASPGSLPRLKAAGYKHIPDTDNPPLVDMGTKGALHAAIQTRLSEGWRAPRSSVRRLRTESIEHTKDPRFIAADFLANYAFRNFSRTLPGEMVLGLPVTTLRHGAALEALSMAHDALHTGDLAGALDMLAAVKQPDEHDDSVRRLLDQVGDLADVRLPQDPRLADRLLDRAERILEFRRYGLMAQAERLAGVVLDAPDVGEDFVRRAHGVLGTAANHQGKYRVAKRALDAALDSAKTSTPSIQLALDICDLENRRAVSEMNVFHFDLEQRLAPRLKLVDSMVHQLLGDNARERIAGELAGTLGQAAVFMGERERAQGHFAAATRHLGEDHMQAAFRAHAAIQWGDEQAAMTAAQQALGSTYGREGYDLGRGAEELGHPVRCIEQALSAAPFNAWLVLKLGARGWLSMEKNELDAIEHALLADSATHHPHTLIAIDGGRLLAQHGRHPAAAKVWRGALSRTPSAEPGPTLEAMRLQLTAELALAQREGHLPQPSSSERNWPDRLTRDASALREHHPDLSAHFGEAIARLGAKPDAAAIRGLLARFTFLYT